MDAPDDADPIGMLARQLARRYPRFVSKDLADNALFRAGMEIAIADRKLPRDLRFSSPWLADELRRRGADVAQCATDDIAHAVIGWSAVTPADMAHLAGPWVWSLRQVVRFLGYSIVFLFVVLLLVVVPVEVIWTSGYPLAKEVEAQIIYFGLWLGLALGIQRAVRADERRLRCYRVVPILMRAQKMAARLTGWRSEKSLLRRLTSRSDRNESIDADGLECVGPFVAGMIGSYLISPWLFYVVAVPGMMGVGCGVAGLLLGMAPNNARLNQRLVFERIAR